MSTNPSSSNDHTPATPDAPALGTLAWLDLTVDNASQVRDFYQSVLHWQPINVPMRDSPAPGSGPTYHDYGMAPVTTPDAPVTGVCHARGPNTGLPAVWIPYFTVADVQQAVSAAQAAGGSLIGEIRPMGSGKVAFVRDPAGATFAVCGA